MSGVTVTQGMQSTGFTDTGKQYGFTKQSADDFLANWMPRCAVKEIELGLISGIE